MKYIRSTLKIKLSKFNNLTYLYLYLKKRYILKSYKGPRVSGLSPIRGNFFAEFILL